MSDPVFIIPCGFKKCITPTKAQSLYIGPYFKSNLRWALKKSKRREDIFILSAKHGLLPLDEIVKPYNLKMGMPGSIVFKTLHEQAVNRNLLNRLIIAVGGQEYLGLLFKVFKQIKTPFKGLSMGYSMKATKNDLRNYYE